MSGLVPPGNLFRIVLIEIVCLRVQGIPSCRPSSSRADCAVYSLNRVWKDTEKLSPPAVENGTAEFSHVNERAYYSDPVQEKDQR